MCSKRLFRQVLVKSEPRVKSGRQDKEGRKGELGWEGGREGGRNGVRSIPRSSAAAGWQKAVIMLNVMCPSRSGVKTGWKGMA